MTHLTLPDMYFSALVLYNMGRRQTFFTSVMGHRAIGSRATRRSLYVYYQLGVNHSVSIRRMHSASLISLCGMLYIYNITDSTLFLWIYLYINLHVGVLLVYACGNQDSRPPSVSPPPGGERRKTNLSPLILHPTADHCCDHFRCDTHIARSDRISDVFYLIFRLLSIASSQIPNPIWYWYFSSTRD